MKTRSIKNLLNEAKVFLKDISATPYLDAELLLSHVLGKDRVYIFAYPEYVLPMNQYQQWQELLMKRRQRVPIAYLTGQKEFWGLMLEVNEHTLIPRPETELMIEILLEHYENDVSSLACLDLGTGSGAIALAVAKEKPHWHITAIDISIGALAVARRNAQKNNIHNVNFVQSDWFALVKKKVDIIMSNPPYLAEDDSHLLTEDICHEPQSALVAGNHGLADIEKIIADARRYLKPGGYLFIEHGCKQGEDVKALFKLYGYPLIYTKKDLAGLARISFARYE